MISDLNQIGNEVQQFLRRKGWLSDPPSIELAAIKVAEEAGEINGAIVKWIEGRQSTDEVANEIADLIIATASLAHRMNFDLDLIVENRWAEVKER